MVVDDGNLNQTGEIGDAGHKHEGEFHPDLHYQEDGPVAEMTKHYPESERVGKSRSDNLSLLGQQL